MEPWQITSWGELDIVLRLLIAALMGGLIGYEREHAEKPAGFRTHILVCVGSALFTIVSVYGFVGENSLTNDPARIAAGIVVGIGFLGAGTILSRERGVVGLTTAASIWTVAAVGLAVGVGLYLVAITTVIIILVALRLPGGSR